MHLSMTLVDVSEGLAWRQSQTSQRGVCAQAQLIHFQPDAAGRLAAGKGGAGSVATSIRTRWF
jgi:hypothetical protein